MGAELLESGLKYYCCNLKALRKVRLDTLSNYGMTFLKLLISIMSVPVYLTEFGEVNYGIYILTFGFAMSLSFLDFGAGKSLLRYTAEYSAHKDLPEYQKAISVNLTISLISTLLITTVIVISGFFAESLFEVTQENLMITKKLFFLSAVFCVIYFTGTLPASILQGFQIFHERNKLQ